MNELAELQNNETFQKMVKACHRMTTVRNFDDLEALYLRGDGLSANTYRNYRLAVKDFYNFTDGLNPLQVSIGHIEMYYDSIAKKLDPNTAYLRIAGLKKFFEGVRKQLPFFESPFDTMSESVKKKFSQTKKGEQKKALYRKEITAILKDLENQAMASLEGKQTRAAVLTLLLTGLRSFELCNIKFEDIEHDTDEERHFITGIGKGTKPFRVYLHPTALHAITTAFDATFHRMPKPGDYIFWSTRGRLQKATLWARLNKMGDRLKAWGDIRKEIEFSAHLFRRSILTQYSKMGMAVRDLQGAARHSSIKTTMDHYVEGGEDTKPYLDRLLQAV